MELKNYLVVIEAPLDEPYSTAAIQEIRTGFGDKPIRYVVSTHAHLDAVGGLRAYAAEGATIVPQDLNRKYLEKILNQPHIVKPDKMAAKHHRVVVEGAGEKRIITDGVDSVELFNIPNGHASGMLIAYIPKEKVIVESGLYTIPDSDIIVSENAEPVIPRSCP